MLMGRGLRKRRFADTPIAMDKDVPARLNKSAPDVLQKFVPTPQQLWGADRCRSAQHTCDDSFEILLINALDAHAALLNESLIAIISCDQVKE
jgi:hypothetical protein